MDQDQLPEPTTKHLTKSQKNRREIQKKIQISLHKKKSKVKIKVPVTYHDWKFSITLSQNQEWKKQVNKKKKIWLNPVQYLKLVIDTSAHEMESLHQLW